MMGMSHAAFALFLYGLLGGMAGDITISHMAVAALAGLVPDVDQPQSALGMLFFPVSHYINSKYGHRTVTHCLKFLVVASLITLPLCLIDFLYWLAVPVGIFAHLMSDGMTVSGVPLLYPNTTPFYFLPESLLIKTGSIHEIAFFAVFMILALLFAGIGYIGGSVSLIAKLMPSFLSAQRQYVARYDTSGVHDICYVSGYYIPGSLDVEGLCTGSDGYSLIIRTNTSYYLLTKYNTKNLRLHAKGAANVTTSERVLEHTHVESIYDEFKGVESPVILSGELYGNFYTTENRHPEVLKVTNSKATLNHVLLNDITLNGYIESGKLHYKVLKDA